MRKNTMKKKPLYLNTLPNFTYGDRGLFKKTHKRCGKRAYFSRNEMVRESPIWKRAENIERRNYSTKPIVHPKKLRRTILMRVVSYYGR